MKKQSALKKQMTLRTFKEEWDKYDHELDKLINLCKTEESIFNANVTILYYEATSPDRSLLNKTTKSHESLLQKLIINKEKIYAFLEQINDYSKEDKSAVSMLRKAMGKSYRVVRLKEITCHFYLSADYASYILHPMLPPSRRNVTASEQKKKEKSEQLRQLQNLYDHLLSCWEKILQAQKDAFFSEDFSSDAHRRLMNEIAESHSLVMSYGWLHDHYTVNDISKPGCLLSYYHKILGKDKEKPPSFNQIFIKNYRSNLEKRTTLNRAELWQETSVLASVFHDSLLSKPDDFPNKEELIPLMQTLSNHYSKLIKLVDKNDKRKNAMFWLELTAFIEQALNVYRPTWGETARNELLKALETLFLEVTAYSPSFKFDLRQWRIKLDGYLADVKLGCQLSEKVTPLFLKKYQSIDSDNNVEQETELPNLIELEEALLSNKKTIKDCKIIKTTLDQKINEIAIKKEKISLSCQKVQEELEQEVSILEMQWEKNEFVRKKREELSQKEHELVIYNLKLRVLIKKFDDSLKNNTQVITLLAKMNDLISSLKRVHELSAKIEKTESDDNTKKEALALLADKLFFKDFEPFDEVNTTEWDPIHIEEYAETLTILNRYKEEFVHLKAIEVSFRLKSSEKRATQIANHIQNDLYFFIEKHALFLAKKYASQTANIVLDNHHKLLPSLLDHFPDIKHQFGTVYDPLTDLKTRLEESEKCGKSLTEFAKEAHQWATAMVSLGLLKTSRAISDKKKKEEFYYCLDKIVSHFEENTPKLLLKYPKESSRLSWDIILLINKLSVINHGITCISLNSELLSRVLTFHKRAIELLKTLKSNYFLNEQIEIFEEGIKNDQKKLDAISATDALTPEYQALTKEYEDIWMQLFQKAIEEHQKPVKKQNPFEFGARYTDENSDDDIEESETDTSEETKIIPPVLENKGPITLKQLQENLEAAQKEQVELNIISSHYDLANCYLTKSIKSARKIKRKGVNFALKYMQDMHMHLNIALEKMDDFLTVVDAEEKQVHDLKNFIDNLQERTNHWV